MYLITITLNIITISIAITFSETFSERKQNPLVWFDVIYFHTTYDMNEYKKRKYESLRIKRQKR